MSDEEWIELGFMLDDARNYYDLESYDKAIDQYLNILKSNQLEYNDRATVIAELGYCYYEIGDFESALDRLQIAKELDETLNSKSGFRRILGSCLFQLGKYKEAINYQKKVLEISENSEEKSLSLFQLGRSYLFAGYGKTALKYLKKHLNTLPSHDIENRLDAMYNMGFAYLLMKKVKKAELSFQFLIENNKNSEDLARGYYGLTELSYHQGNYKIIKEYGQKVLDINDKFSERETILFYIIIALTKEGNKSQIAELADKFIKEFPESKYINEVKTLM